MRNGRVEEGLYCLPSEGHEWLIIASDRIIGARFRHLPFHIVWDEIWMFDRLKPFQLILYPLSLETNYIHGWFCFLKENNNTLRLITPLLAMILQQRRFSLSKQAFPMQAICFCRKRFNFCDFSMNPFDKLSLQSIDHTSELFRTL
ncbi:hypothetical protein T07_1934 [Trichinella nelsoni]|uniref:Uncharacterized protein n=1 Tax=Trichinella nelsoni TaxID=6336 RepID=A0A0V0SIT8_9BILA|nr:hypothetical protein T07_1934 [Trichinella nelsoni]